MGQVSTESGSMAAVGNLGKSGTGGFRRAYRWAEAGS